MATRHGRRTASTQDDNVPDHVDGGLGGVLRWLVGAGRWEGAQAAGAFWQEGSEVALVGRLVAGVQRCGGMMMNERRWPLPKRKFSYTPSTTGPLGARHSLPTHAR